MKNLIFAIIAIILITSCKKNNNKVNSHLENIDDIISINPDSALHVLNSINISPNDEYNTNLFRYYIIKCKSKLNKDISIDTDIINVYNYFKEKKELYYAAQASYLCGLVMESNKEYDKAINYFNIAESYAINNNDIDFHIMILYSKSELFLNQLLIDQAKFVLEKANKLSRKTENYQYEIKGYSNIAFSFLIKEQYDSSLYYYDKAYEIASLNQNNMERAYAIKDKGLIYLDKGDFRTAIDLINNAKNIDSTIVKSGKVDLILSDAYLGLGKIDSARFYVNKSLYWVKHSENDSTEMLRTIYRYFSDIEESVGNYKDALAYSKLYNTSLDQYATENRKDAIIDAERKYKYEAAQKEIAELSLSQIKRERLILILSLVITVSTIIYYYIILKKNRLLLKKNEDILSLTDSLTDFEKAKDEYEHTVKGYADKMKTYYTDIYEILKRAAALEYFVQDSGDKRSKILIKRFNEIAYGQDKIDWDKLYNTINVIYDNYFYKIKEQFPELDESEYRICCLTIAKMTSNEIAAIMQLSVNTIHMKTTNIRKKLKIEKYGNIPDFFENNVK